jgi:hypothetical protein
MDQEKEIKEITTKITENKQMKKYVLPDYRKYKRSSANTKCLECRKRQDYEEYRRKQRELKSQNK